MPIALISLAAGIAHEINNPMAYVLFNPSYPRDWREDEVLPRIFDPFFTTKPAGTGTGLGSSISHSLVRKMGGELRVHSQMGVGTTFSLLLPLAEHAAGPRAVLTS